MVEVILKTKITHDRRFGRNEKVRLICRFIFIVCSYLFHYSNSVLNIRYFNYFEVCKAYDIDYKAFLGYKKANNSLGEFSLLGRFIPNLRYNMSEGAYSTRKLGS